MLTSFYFELKEDVDPTEFPCRYYVVHCPGGMFVSMLKEDKFRNLFMKSKRIWRETNVTRLVRDLKLECEFNGELGSLAFDEKDFLFAKLSAKEWNEFRHKF